MRARRTFRRDAFRQLIAHRPRQEEVDGSSIETRREKHMNEQELTVRERVESALATVRPALRADGGDVELVDVTDEGVVSVRLTGACGGCPMSTMTLKMGIERVLREQVAEVKSVEAV
jgi:Fe-S cluster biogenesis protein NfuA